MDEELTVDERLIAEQTVVILLVRGEDEEGEVIYAYVALRGDRLQEFMRSQEEGGTFYPEDFGVIVESGTGEPSAEVELKMSTEFGFDHESQIGIPDSATAYRIAETFGDALEKGTRPAS